MKLYKVTRFESREDSCEIAANTLEDAVEERRRMVFPVDPTQKYVIDFRAEEVPQPEKEAPPVEPTL